MKTLQGENKEADKAYSRLTNGLFQNFVNIIKRPESIGIGVGTNKSEAQKNKEKLNYWNKALKWCDPEELWFSAADVFWNLDPEQLKKRLKEMIVCQIEKNYDKSDR